MTTSASTRHSDVGMSCVQCGEPLIAPLRSAYVSPREVLNLWSCPACGFALEVPACLPEDLDPDVDKKVVEQFFPSLLVA